MRASRCAIAEKLSESRTPSTAPNPISPAFFQCPIVPSSAAAKAALRPSAIEPRIIRRGSLLTQVPRVGQFRRDCVENQYLDSSPAARRRGIADWRYGGADALDPTGGPPRAYWSHPQHSGNANLAKFRNDALRFISERKQRMSRHFVRRRESHHGEQRRRDVAQRAALAHRRRAPGVKAWHAVQRVRRVRLARLGVVHLLGIA